LTSRGFLLLCSGMKPKHPVKTYVKCRGCGKRIARRRSKFCPDCFKLDHRLHSEDIPLEGRKSFWAYLRKYGRRCHLSGVSLEIDDYASPWYLVFSRLVPGNNSKIAPASALFDVMKSRLLKREFRYYALALDDNREKHLKIKKIPLVHWPGLNLSMDERVCDGCGRAAALKGHKFCATCARLARRMKLARFPRKAILAVWAYIRKYGFVCYYTGMPLDLDDTQSPWYLVFDHWMPRDPRKIVITSALVNTMKSDLTEDEFWYFIRQLANFYRNGTPVRKRKLKVWARPYRVPAQYRPFRPSGQNGPHPRRNK
jgi:hypothetical protein